jgi:hypothetical protein
VDIAGSWHSRNLPHLETCVRVHPGHTGIQPSCPSVGNHCSRCHTNIQPGPVPTPCGCSSLFTLWPLHEVPSSVLSTPKPTVLTLPHKDGPECIHCRRQRGQQQPGGNVNVQVPVAKMLLQALRLSLLFLLTLALCTWHWHILYTCSPMHNPHTGSSKQACQQCKWIRRHQS